MDLVKAKGFWIRFLAFLIDFTLYEAVFMFLGIWVTENNIVSFMPFLPNVVIAYILFLLVFPWLFNSLILVLFGTTLGKFIIRAKIVDAQTGEKPAKKQLIIRSASYIISWFSLFLGFFGIAFNKQKVAFHDRLSNTLVVSKKIGSSEISNIHLSRSKFDFVVIALFSVLMIFNIYILSIFSTDEKLTPLAEKWLFTEKVEENPQENGYYWLIGFSAPKESNQFDYGFDYVQTANSNTKNYQQPGYIPKTQIQFESILDFDHLTNIGVVVTDSLDSNSLLLKNSAEVKGLAEKFSYLDERMMRIQSKNTFINTIIPSVSASVPIHMNLVYYYRLKSALSRLYYLEGDYQKAISILDKSFQENYFLLENTRTLIGKLVANVVISILQNAVSELINIKDTSELTSFIDDIAPLSSSQMSLDNAFKYESNLILSSIDLLLLKARIEKSDEIKTLERTVSIFFKRNHMFNKNCDIYHSVSELSTMDFVSFNKSYQENISLNNLHFQDFIRSPFGYFLLQTGPDIYKTYTTKFQQINAKPILLKLKNKIVSEKINESEVQEFLNNQPKELYNPFTEKPVKWNAEKQRIEFELDFSKPTDDFWVKIDF